MALIKCKECNHEISTAATACPNCGARLRATTRPVFKVLGGLIVLLFVAALFVPNDKNSSSASGEAQASAATQSPPIQAGANELQADYDANTVAADAKYKGRRVIITGSITNINTDFENQPYVTLQAKNQFGEPQASLAPSARTAAAQLRKGEIVTLSCTGNGDIAKTPMLKDCTISQ